MARHKSRHFTCNHCRPTNDNLIAAGLDKKWIPLGGKVYVSRRKLMCRSLCLIEVYGRSPLHQYPVPVEETSDVLRNVTANLFTILLGDFSPDVGYDVDVWQGVIVQYGDGNINGTKKLLQLRCNKALCIMNTFFQNRDLETCCRDSLGQRSLIYFYIVSTDMVQSVLNVRVKKGAELPTDHSQAFCKLHLEVPTGPTQTRRTRRSYRENWKP